MAVWSCPSCGAEILAEKTTGATVCPYCDNPMIMPEQFKDSYRPDYIIPFQKSKKEAVEALKKHYEGKPLLPKIFKEQNHLEEIKAVYVPFWLFDLDTAAVSATKRPGPVSGMMRIIHIQKPNSIMLSVPGR